MNYLKEQIEQDFAEVINNIFGLQDNILIALRENQTVKEFDYQIDCSFLIAKHFKKNPIEIAETITINLKRHDIYKEVTASKPGFINIKINKDFLESYLLETIKIESSNKKNIIVDYPSPNVAKEMHVGHLRSAIIGDAISRILEYLGHNVIRQNHIGDWGTQFGFLIEYILEHNLELKNITEISNIYKKARETFDNNQEFEIRARSRLLKLQAKEQDTYKIWQALYKVSLTHFDEIAKKLGLKLTEEDIKGESFYNEMLPGIVEDLTNKSIAVESAGAQVIFLEGFYDKDKNPVPMIIKKSDGGYLYHTTDLAAANYRANELHADKIIYVVDARQKQHFEMLFAALKKSSLFASKISFCHVGFGTVLGEDKKPFKTRSGETVSLLSLLNEAEAKAKEGVLQKYQDLPEEEVSLIANKVGIGALKYADLSNDLTRDYVFSFERMLSFNGNTAPYLQNAYVRIKSIFRKENLDFETTKKYLIITSEAERKLCVKLTEFPDVIMNIEEKLTPHLLCNYLYDLASLFHNFYENCPVAKCADESVKQARFYICYLAANQLKLGLSLLGIDVIEKM